jgi:hypothetical protein
LYLLKTFLVVSVSLIGVAAAVAIIMVSRYAVQQRTSKASALIREGYLSQQASTDYVEMKG